MTEGKGKGEAIEDLSATIHQIFSQNSHVGTPDPAGGDVLVGDAMDVKEDEEMEDFDSLFDEPVATTAIESSSAPATDGISASRWASVPEPTQQQSGQHDVGTGATVMPYGPSGSGDGAIASQAFGGQSIPFVTIPGLSFQMGANPNSGTTTAPAAVTMAPAIQQQPVTFEIPVFLPGTYSKPTASVAPVISLGPEAVTNAGPSSHTTPPPASPASSILSTISPTALDSISDPLPLSPIEQDHEAPPAPAPVATSAPAAEPELLPGWTADEDNAIAGLVSDSEDNAGAWNPAGGTSPASVQASPSAGPSSAPAQRTSAAGHSSAGNGSPPPRRITCAPKSRLSQAKAKGIEVRAPVGTTYGQTSRPDCFMYSREWLAGFRQWLREKWLGQELATLLECPPGGRERCLLAIKMADDKFSDDEDLIDLADLPLESRYSAEDMNDILASWWKSCVMIAFNEDKEWKKLMWKRFNSKIKRPYMKTHGPDC